MLHYCGVSVSFPRTPQHIGRRNQESIGVYRQLLTQLLFNASVVVSHPKCLNCRCEQTLFNAPGEALALTDAARLFLSSEKENRALQAPGFDEHLQAALNCYGFAIKVHYDFLISF